MGCGSIKSYVMVWVVRKSKIRLESRSNVDWPGKIFELRLTMKFDVRPPQIQGLTCHLNLKITSFLAFPTMQPPYRSAPRAPTAAQPSMRNAIAARPITGQQPGIQSRSGPIGGTQPVSVSAQGRTANYKYTANMRNPPQPMPVTQQAQVQQVTE